MASNRGPNAVSAPANEDVTSSPFSRAYSRAMSTDAAITATASETGSENGSIATASGKLPSASPKPGGKRSSYYEDAVRSVLQPGQRAMFFGKGQMGVVLKPTYLAR